MDFGVRGFRASYQSPPILSASQLACKYGGKGFQGGTVVAGDIRGNESV